VDVIPLGGVIGCAIVGCAAIFGLFQLAEHWLSRRP
jgi:hypothetical protein